MTNKIKKCLSDCSALCTFMSKRTAGKYRENIGFSQDDMVDNTEDVQFYEVTLRLYKKETPTVLNFCPFCGTNYYTHNHKRHGLSEPKNLVAEVEYFD